MKRGIVEKLDSFLNITQKLLSKQRHLINISKQKSNLAIQNLNTVSISSIFNLGKKIFIISKLLTILNKSVINIAITSINAYYIIGKLKKTWDFAIFIKNLKF